MLDRENYFFLSLSNLQVSNMFNCLLINCVILMDEAQMEVLSSIWSYGKSLMFQQSQFIEKRGKP